MVFTGAGDKAFCTGGNTKEYAEYYAGNPQEYRGYMRLFNDMVSAILGCDKPVVCRVNGMRIGGGQEIGMACDFSIAQDLARFGQAGPKHGSAPIGGATDFLPYMIGCEQAMVSGLLCEPFSAHKAYRLGIISDIVPALKVDGKFVANPTVTTDRYLDDYGCIVHGEFKTGAAAAEGQALFKRGTVDLSLLDEKVEALCTKLLYTFPECTTKTVEELRKPKLHAWNANKENSRDWLALNMMTEAARVSAPLTKARARPGGKSISWRCAARSPPTRRGATSSLTAFSRGRGPSCEPAAQDLARGGRPLATAAAESSEGQSDRCRHDRGARQGAGRASRRR